jgi:hypothetical protein
LIPTTQKVGSNYSLRVTSTTNAAYSGISNAFTIVGPTITVVSPNGSEVLRGGTKSAIKCSYTGNPGTYVTIQLYKSGLLNRTIASYVPVANRTYNWTIPSTQAIGSDYKIKITSKSNASLYGLSNAYFTITR